MKIEMVGVETITPYKRNPRHNEDAVDKVAASIQLFGFKQPIRRRQRARDHRRSHAAARGAQARHQAGAYPRGRDLTPSQVRAYRLADNRVHEESTWDEELVALELGDLSKLGFKHEATGFDADEISALLKLDQGGLLEGVDEDAVPPAPKKPPRWTKYLGAHPKVQEIPSMLRSELEGAFGAETDLRPPKTPYSISKCLNLRGRKLEECCCPQTGVLGQGNSLRRAGPLSFVCSSVR